LWHRSPRKREGKHDIVEKILARASGKKHVAPGNYVTADIDMAMMPRIFRLIRGLLAKAGIKEDSFKVVGPGEVRGDHGSPVPPHAGHGQMRTRWCVTWPALWVVKYFYDVFPGVCHQVMVEKGTCCRGI